MLSETYKGLLIIISILCCLYPLPVQAKEVISQGYESFSPEEEFLFSKDEIVVSAAKYAQKIIEAPSTIYVITAEEIHQSGLTSLPDILRTVPGLDVINLSATQAEVGARGFFNQPQSNRMLMMINGRPLFQYSNHFIVWGAIPVELIDIKRIEVVIGPGSALYGANAFAGLINIITCKPEEAKNIHYSGFAGTDHSLSQSILSGGTWRQLGWKLSSGWNKTDRWGEKKEAADMFKANMALETRFKDEDYLRLDGSLISGHTEFFVDQPLGLFDFKNMMLLGLTLTSQWKGFKVVSSYDSGTIDSLQESYPYGSHPIDYKTANVQGQYTFTPAQWCKFVLGSEYGHININWPSMLDRHHYLNDISAFLQAAFFPFPSLSITAGGRYDNYHTVGERWSSRGSVIYSFLRDHALRFSYGNAFRTPSYSETYWAITLPFPVENTLLTGLNLSINGNRNLEPESIHTFEAGYQGGFFNNRLEIRATLFHNTLSDFIYARVVDGFALPPPFSIFVPTEIGLVNFGNAQAYGGELAFNHHFSKQIKSFANYAYQHLEFTEDDPYTSTNEKNKTIRSTPTHKVNLGIIVSSENGVSANLNAHYVSPTRWSNSLWPQPVTDLDAFLLLNTRIALSLIEDKLEVAFSVYNLLNDIHREYTTGYDIGRRFFFSIHLDL